MKIQPKPILAIGSGVLSILALLLVLVQTAGAMSLPNPFQRLLAGKAPAAVFEPDYFVSGKIKLDYAMPGEFTDPLPDPSTNADALPDLGEIDISLKLTLDGTTLNGYVDRENTLVFNDPDPADGTALGVHVTGTLDHGQITLISDPYTITSAKRVMERQFRLTGIVLDGVFTGEFRETIRNYTAEPISVVGIFALSAVSTQQHMLFMPIVRR